jgi:hypothetical protein
MSNAVESITKPINKGLNAIWKPIKKFLRPKTPTATVDPSGTTISSAESPVIYALGKVSSGGVRTFAQEQSGDQTKNEWIHVVYCLAEGEIAGVDEIYIDDKLIGEYSANDISYEVIINPTTPNAFLLANCSDWKETMIGKGLSWVRISYKYGNTFTSIPEARFVYRGLISVYDPRSDSYGFSDNPALHELWVLKNKQNVSDDEIVYESFIDAANRCDELVTNPDGSISKRYTCSSLFTDEDDVNSILERIEASCAGQLCEVGGRFMFYVGTYYGGYDYTINEDALLAISGVNETSLADSVNTITGTFTNPNGSWESTDFTPAVNTVMLAEDGGTISESLTLDFVTDVYQAQRLADIELKKRNNGATYELELDFTGYNCRPHRIVRVYLPQLGIDGEFIVTNWDMSSDDACKVTVREYGEYIFDDSVGVEYVPVNPISINTASMQPPTGLTWTKYYNKDNEQGILSWTPSSLNYDYFGVIIRDTLNNIIQTYQVNGGSNCVISGLDAGNYVASVYVVYNGRKSNEASISISIDLPDAPEIVTYTSTIDTIVIIPSNPTKGINNGWYEFYYSMSSVADPVNNATRLGEGATFAHQGLSFNTQYHYYIRSKNNYGVSASFYHLEASTSDSVSNLLTALNQQITESQLAESLMAEIGDAIAVGGELSILQTDINNLSTDVQGKINTLTESFNSQISAINATLADITNAPVYDVNEPSVLTGKFRTYNDKLYRALSDMTSPIPVPTNDTYWVYVGDYTSLSDVVNNISSEIVTLTSSIDGQARSLSSLRSYSRAMEDNENDQLVDALYQAEFKARFTEEIITRASEDEALAQRITLAEASIGDNEASITQLIQVVADADSALAIDIEELNSSLNVLDGKLSDTNSALSATSSAVDTLESRVDATESGISSLAYDATELKAQVDLQGIAQRGDDGDADLVDALNSVNINATLTSESIVRATETSALAQRIDTAEASIGDINSSITNIEQTIVNESESTSLALTELTATINSKASASALNAIEARVTVNEGDIESIVKNVDALEATITDPATGLSSKASAEDLTEVSTTLDSVRAQRTLKVAAQDSNGRYVLAGIALSADGTVSQSKIYMLADEVAILNGANGTATSPFIVSGGNVYINSAFINQLTANTITATSLIRSSDGKMVLDFTNKTISITV